MKPIIERKPGSIWALEMKSIRKAVKRYFRCKEAWRPRYKKDGDVVIWSSEEVQKENVRRHLSY